MKLVVLVAALALVAAEQPRTFVREVGPLQARLSSGEGAAAAGAADRSARSVLISNRIINFVEGYRTDIQHGNEVHPPLDPFRTDELGPIIVGTDGLILFRLRTLLNNLQVTGINSFVIEELVFSLLRMNLNFLVTIPNIRVQTDYTAEARLALVVTHRVSGFARVTVSGISVDGFMQLAVVGGSLQATQLNLNIDVDDTFISLTELTGVGVVDLVLSWVIQNVSSDAIQASMGDISLAVSKGLHDTINGVLGRYTLEDLIGS